MTEGKIRAYGWSTDDPERARVFAEGAHCAAVQHILNLFRDAPQMLRLCREFESASVNRTPLMMGLLTGKFGPETIFPENDVRYPANFREGQGAERLKRLESIRKVLVQGGRTLAQAALGWIWARSQQTIPIPGFKTLAQVEENIGAMEFGPLSEGQMVEIDEILGREPVLNQ